MVFVVEVVFVEGVVVDDVLSWFFVFFCGIVDVFVSYDVR